MSANVWFEEVNIGLLQELKDTIKIKNSDGEMIPLYESGVGKDKHFLVRKPEEDLKYEVYPCVSIYNRSYKFDPQRYDPQLVIVNRNHQTGKVNLQEPHTPFNLSYQIDFWARYQMDMDSMLKSWLERHFRQFNLKVTDDGGIVRYCNCMMRGSVIKSDLMQNNERLYHSIVNLLMWVELDSELEYNKDMVGRINVDITKKEV